MRWNWAFIACRISEIDWKKLLLQFDIKIYTETVKYFHFSNEYFENLIPFGVKNCNATWFLVHNLNWVHFENKFFPMLFERSISWVEDYIVQWDSFNFPLLKSTRPGGRQEGMWGCKISGCCSHIWFSRRHFHFLSKEPYSFIQILKPYKSIHSEL